MLENGSWLKRHGPWLFYRHFLLGKENHLMFLSEEWSKILLSLMTHDFSYMH